MYDKTRNYFFALDMDSDTRRKALLLHNAGDDIFDIYDAMTDEQRAFYSKDEHLLWKLDKRHKKTVKT